MFLVSQTPLLVSDLPTALWVMLGLVLMFQVLGGISRLLLGQRLRRIEARLAEREAKNEVKSEPVRAETSASEGGKHFDQFLAEDPARGEMTKKEQSAAFRKWRQEKGLTWDK